MLATVGSESKSIEFEEGSRYGFTQYHYDLWINHTGDMKESLRNGDSRTAISGWDSSLSHDSQIRVKSENKVKTK